MASSYDVRVWKTDVYRGKRATTYYVRWAVAGRRKKAAFRTRALADSFRSELVSATRRGEAFDIESGLPELATVKSMPWYDFACQYVDMKWPRVAATTRRTHAEALTAVTVALLTTGRGRPDDAVVRRALCRWAFNTSRRDSPDCPPEVKAALRWIVRHTRPVSDLADPEVLRAVLDHLAVKLDGTPAASSVTSRRRKILNAAIEHAVERRLLDGNPMPALRWKPPRVAFAVDRRVVANPLQARTLLRTVGELPRSGPRLVAFFGCLYYAALRPEEAAALAKHHLALPAQGWGELHLGVAEPHAGKDWTDNGHDRDRRQLKQRDRGEIRPVPCPPELTALLHAHIQQFGTGPDGRLFVGERNGRQLPKLTIVRAWKRARSLALTPEVAASPLAGTPYALRHAAVSTWLNGGVPPAQVAEWAGHSVEVLLRIYAKCLDGGTEVLRRRVEAALGH